MCVFCAAIPMTISMGVVAASKQRDLPPTLLRSRLPIPKLTAAAVITLTAGSVTYHMLLAPKIGL